MNSQKITIQQFGHLARLDFNLLCSRSLVSYAYFSETMSGHLDCFAGEQVIFCQVWNFLKLRKEDSSSGEFLNTGQTVHPFQLKYIYSKLLTYCNLFFFVHHKGGIIIKGIKLDGYEASFQTSVACFI